MVDYYTRLLELRRAEGSAHGLSKLPGDFYPQTRSYLAELKSTFETELRENPSGRKGELARQTHQRAVQTARDIVEARMMKILTGALQASLGGARDLPNALPEERLLHESLLGFLRRHRSEVAPYLEPVGPAVVASKKSGSSTPRPATPERAPVRASTISAGGDETPVVRILQDSPKVAIGAETIALRRDDLVSLPAEVARLLVQGRVAEPVRAQNRFSPALL